MNAIAFAVNADAVELSHARLIGGRCAYTELFTIRRLSPAPNAWAIERACVSQTLVR